MERKVTVVTTVGKTQFAIEVDPKELANKLNLSRSAAKGGGVRPGQPLELTATGSDPISLERFQTLRTALDSANNGAKVAIRPL